MVFEKLQNQVPLLEFDHKPPPPPTHGCFKDCFKVVRLCMILMWLVGSLYFMAFTGAVLSFLEIYEDAIFHYVWALVLLGLICLASGAILNVTLNYVERRTDIMFAKSPSDTAVLDSKLDQLTEKLDKLLSDASSTHRRSSQSQDQVVVLKGIRHLSVKATHSSETRTPSALDMSPIVPETTFPSLSDNQVQTDDQRVPEDDHPCDQHQSGDTSDYYGDVSPPTLNSLESVPLNWMSEILS